MSNTGQVGQALRQLRKVAHLTLSDVAELADTAPAYLSKVESGALVPTAAYVARVAKAIALSMEAASTVERAA